MASQLINIYGDILNEIKYHLLVSKEKLEITNDIVICDERSFQGWFEENKLLPTTIYVIVSFSDGEIWFGNTIIPATLVVYSEQETFENTRLLLTYFATQFNFRKGIGTNNATLIQSYNVPSMREEFIEEGNSYRAIFDLSATFVYGENVNGISELYINNEPITFLSTEIDFTATPNVANLGNNNDRTDTKNASATFSMSLSVPSTLDSEFVKKVDDLMFGNEDINTTFDVVIKKGNTTYPSRTLHFISINYNQEITGIPMYAIGLGE